MAPVIEFSKTKKFALTNVADVGVIVFNTPEPITDDLWSEYCEVQASFAKAHGIPKYVLNITPYEGPNAKQRKVLDSRQEELGIKQIKFCALVSESMMVRGGLTALGWVLKSVTLKAFAPRELEKACDWLLEQKCAAPKVELLATTRALMASVGLKL